VLGAALLAVAVGAAAYALYRDRHDFATTFDRIGPGAVVASVAFGVLGVGATFPMWREMLKALGVSLPWGDGGRVFFVTQIGKYLPGSVWPAFMQMEAGRRRGATRATMLWANLSALILNCAVGLSVACVLLPIYDRHAFDHYWWVLLALPALVAPLHPRVLPMVMDAALRLLRQPARRERVDPRAELRAVGWSLLSWAGFGGHLAVLVVATGRSSADAVALSVGAMALAVPLGVLVIPAPAGAGIREVVLVLVLGSLMSTGQALAVAVGSRAILVLCDLLLAGVAGLTGIRPRYSRAT
jgi:hypothetical protein